jgi:hypothetical protein
VLAQRAPSQNPLGLSRYELDKLTAGATEFFAHIGADTMQRVNAEFATRRQQFKKTTLRWRVRSFKTILGVDSVQGCADQTSR